MSLPPLTLLLVTVAAGCFYVAALAPIENRVRGLVAIVGIVIDWLPVALGWMSLAGSPAPVLYASHLVFGVAGYALLLYCPAAWLRDRNRRLAVRAVFLAVWTVALLAGLGMATAGPR
jgi:hypothetical protein